MESPFDVLLIDADADEDELERAYRNRVKEAHPDHGGSLEEFVAVRTAYEAIKTDTPELWDHPGQTDTSEGERDRTGYRTATSTVTYLNYDVLADFGWGIDDAALFEKAARAGLAEDDYGTVRVDPGESLLEGAESSGYAWPFACRGGACANCAILLWEGEVSMPVSHVLPAELMDRGFRLSCNAIPITDELKVVYNVKHIPELEELLLPPRPYERAYPND